MSKMEYLVTESIELSLPVNAAYVSTARLTASSIANRQGFDVDEMEDIKAAVSEACTYIIRKSRGTSSGLFHLIFGIGEGFMDIQFCCEDSGDADDNEMSVLMIKALMDDMTLRCVGGALELRMLKKHHVMEL